MVDEAESLFEQPADTDTKTRPRVTRLRSRKPRDDAGDKPKEQKERKPAATGARVSLKSMGTTIAKGLAFLAENAGMHGASRALLLQSEAAGPAFDQAIRGSIFDTFLQPFAKIGGNAADLGALAALPMSTEAFIRNPNPMTQAGFQAALIGSLPQIAKARKTAAREQAKLEADLANLAEMFGKQPGENVSLNEVALWLMTGSIDGIQPVAESQPEPEPPLEPEPF